MHPDTTFPIVFWREIEIFVSSPHEILYYLKVALNYINPILFLFLNLWYYKNYNIEIIFFDI